MCNRNRNARRARFAPALFAGIILFGCYQLPVTAVAATQSSPHYAAMMGQMGQGMMKGGADRSTASEPATHGAPNKEAEVRLARYISDHNLSCLQCHAMTASVLGPSFYAIATSSAHNPATVRRLVDSIVHGVGRMPAGLATEQQALQLVNDILQLDAQRNGQPPQ